MPLTPPVDRQLMHTRHVRCEGYLRADGLWDIEGHLVDTKPYELPNADRPQGKISAGESLHEMWIRLTVDTDLWVRAVEVITDFGPYAVCGSIAPNFQRLAGLRIKPGWTQETRELLGGVQGCTHLVELLGPLATTAYQTIYPARVKREADMGTASKPVMIDTCHAYRSDGPLVQQRWPRHYTGSQS